MISLGIAVATVNQNKLVDIPGPIKLLMSNVVVVTGGKYLCFGNFAML